jgi:quinol monooxygenase YgiN
MKKISVMLASVMMLFILSCNNAEEKKDEPKAADTTATTETPAPKPFEPFKIMVVQHQVKSYAKFLEVYKGHDSMRLANGIHQYVLGRGIPDSNAIVVMTKTDDVAKAKVFGSSADLKAAMQKAGVAGKPTMALMEVVRLEPADIPQKDRVMVAHHVKDFDAWLKAFDADGKESRAAHGLIDRGIARGVDDPNMVYIVFAVSDMAKAKARSESPELKKLMEGAGVDSKPVRTMYTITDLIK